jgi:hypothetical protein
MGRKPARSLPVTGLVIADRLEVQPFALRDTMSNNFELNLSRRQAMTAGIMLSATVAAPSLALSKTNTAPQSSK